jgi:hypothetical protein
LHILNLRRSSVRLAGALVAVSSFASPALADVISHGMEVWNCGNKTFEVQLGNGQDVALTSIEGSISATSRAGANLTEAVLRQILIAGYPTLEHGQAGFTHGKIIGTPPDTNHSLDGNIWTQNIKVRTDAVVNNFVSYKYDPPVILPEGLLSVATANISYAPVTDEPIFPAQGCLNTEIQLTYQFQQLSTRTAP